MKIKTKEVEAVLARVLPQYLTPHDQPVPPPRRLVREGLFFCGETSESLIETAVWRIYMDARRANAA
jgi:hypothetical protein